MKDTLSKLENLVRRIKLENPENKEKLVNLIEELKREISGVPAPDAEKARSVANFAETAFHEASKSQKDTGLIDLAMEGLEESVKTFEVSHPQLVRIVNDICSLLARLGI